MIYFLKYLILIIALVFVSTICTRTDLDGQIQATRMKRHSWVLQPWFSFGKQVSLLKLAQTPKLGVLRDRFCSQSWESQSHFARVQTFRKFTTKVNLLILTDRLGFIPSAARLSSAGGSAAGVCCCWVAASKEEISLLFVCLNPLFLDVFPKILTKDFIFNWYYDPCTSPYLRIWNFILGMIYCVFIPILIIIIIFVCIHTNFLWLSGICSEVSSSL